MAERKVAKVASRHNSHRSRDSVPYGTLNCKSLPA